MVDGYDFGLELKDKTLWNDKMNDHNGIKEFQMVSKKKESQNLKAFEAKLFRNFFK